MARYLIMSEHGHTDAECAALIREMERDEVWFAQNGLSSDFDTDFGRFKALNDSLRSAGCGPLVPIYDVAYEAIDRTNGVWLRVENAGGETIAVIAARLREVPDLATALADGTFMMGPTPPADASCTFAASGLKGISGPVLFMGSMWVRDDYRGPNKTTGGDISTVIAASLMRHCWYRWSYVRLIVLMSRRHTVRSLGIYGVRMLHGKVGYRDPRWPSPSADFDLLSITAEEIREQVLNLPVAA